MNPGVTFIIPAYNAEKFLADAINSVKAQTVTEWRMIIVDDGSTDSTLSIAESYASEDDRISVIHCVSPSGSAFSPRRIGIEAATTESVAPLDADDRIPTDYLEKLLAAKKRYGADAVYPTMYEWEGSSCRQMIDMGNPEAAENPEGLIIEYNEHLLFSPAAGRDVVRLTLDGWKVYCNGGIIEKDIYLRAFKDFKYDATSANADEVLTRLILLQSRCVVFSDTKYYYRVNPESITRSYSPKRFDLLKAYIDLSEMMLENYGRDSEEYMLAQRHLLHLCAYYLQLINDEFPRSARKTGIANVKEALKNIDFQLIRPYTHRRLWRMMQFPVEISIILTKINDSRKIFTNKARELVRKTLRRPVGKMRYLLQTRKEIKGSAPEVDAMRRGNLLPGSESESYFRKHYEGAEDASRRPRKDTPKSVVCPFDGTLLHGGLTDRLRGVLSTYSEAKQRGIPIKIYWRVPFRLEDYFLPAGDIDWRMTPEEFHRDASKATPIVIQDKSPEVSLRMTRAALDGIPGTMHFYSNSDAEAGHYRELFNELFRPTPLLEEKIKYYSSQLGDKYWAFTFRFGGLLSDFKDCVGTPLDAPAAESLMAESLREMLKLMENLPDGRRVHVTSDSQRFLKYISDKDPRIHIVPGKVINIDLQQGDYDDAWLKTFIDQGLLMDAERVYRMRTGDMYPTGFPKFAAEIGGAEFIDHQY